MKNAFKIQFNVQSKKVNLLLKEKKNVIDLKQSLLILKAKLYNYSQHTSTLKNSIESPICFLVNLKKR